MEAALGLDAADAARAGAHRRRAWRALVKRAAEPQEVREQHSNVAA